MALVVGTNCGFVTVAPTTDPEGNDVLYADAVASAGKFVAPEDGTITEIGWYDPNPTEAANFQVGVYDHDDGADWPDSRLAVSSDTAKGTGAGWKKAAVSYNVVSGTTYWLAAQLDGTATRTLFDIRTGVAGSRWTVLNTQTDLPSPWGFSSSSAAYLLAIYALYTPAAGGLSIPRYEILSRIVMKHVPGSGDTIMLRLFGNDKTPAIGDTFGNYVEINPTGYAPQYITGDSWIITTA